MSSLQVKLARMLATRRDASPEKEARTEPFSVAEPDASGPAVVGRLGGRAEPASAFWERRELEKALQRAGGGAPGAAEPEDTGFFESAGLRRVERTEGGFAHRTLRVPLGEPDASAEKRLFFPGGTPLSAREHENSLRWFGRLAGEPSLEELGARDALFVDIETTGLSGGAGTTAFLVGLGYFEAGAPAFAIEQFLMEDFCDEPAMLAALCERARGFAATVTYNGICFDLPVLRSRFILNGERSPFDAAAPIDLLRPGRRLWGEVAEGASLGALERFVLGFERPGDVPGHLIPAVFLDYARGRRRGAMEAVLRHNAQDILSMARLLGRIAELAEQEPGDLGDGLRPGTLVGLSRLPQPEESEEGRPLRLLEEALRRARDPDDEERCARLLALACRSRRRHEEAADLWAMLWRRGGERAAAYAVEWAKHLEHRRRDFAAALEVVGAALAGLPMEDVEITYEYESDYFDERADPPPPRLTGLPRPTPAWRARLRADLERRRERLERKLAARAAQRKNRAASPSSTG